ncbi:MAG: hypothetical protein N3F09_02815 [Bacteroidia bacterium]|nr:hypothetical protein [Bacteroidia bacterium]
MNPKCFYSTLLILFWIPGILFSQTSCEDSLKNKLLHDSLKIYSLKKILPYFSIDDRITQIQETKSDISGFKIGINYTEKYVFGVGFYSLLSPEKSIVPVSKNKPDTFTISVKMKYFTFFYHQIMLRKKHFELQIPVEIGMGNVQFLHKKKNNSALVDNKTSSIVPFGLGVKSILKPFPHAGIFVFLGVRIIRDKPQYPFNLSGGFSALGIYINLLKINRDIKYYCIKKTNYKKRVKKCH